VTQSNTADTDATATNDNSTYQSVDQDQDALILGGHGAGSITQTQDGSNDNSTTQDATAKAETTQVNVNAPIAILSPGANSGDVEQTNHADTDAKAENDNRTYQQVDQDQRAVVFPAPHDTCKCQPSPCTCDGHGGWTKGDEHPGWSGWWKGHCGCDRGGSITQDQDASNANSTDQKAEAKAATEQKNLNLPISFLSPTHGGGDVTQANDASTTSYAGNDNRTGQKVEQDQFALLKGVTA
jgi:hypothetical protein